MAKRKRQKDLNKDPKYLHGYSIREQKRLYKQAKFLEPYVYESIDFSGVESLLEVGCGVGAQTQILLKRFPRVKITAVDISPVQIAQAQKTLRGEILRGAVNFSVQDATHLPYKDHSFDGVFICWFLEHVPMPLKILKEVRRVLKPGGKIYCTEVQNSSLFLEPYSPAFLKYWFAYNDEQWRMKGDPFVGAKLGHLLKEAKFKNIEVSPHAEHYDSRKPKARAEFIEYWTQLSLSGTPLLLKKKRVTPTLVRNMKKELNHIKNAHDSVFFYTWIRANAEA